MPHMDGMSFIQAVKAHHGYKFTPIVVLSVRSEEEMRQTAREMGVKAWMAKPFDGNKLIEMASRFALS
jgi:DNA-binding response OmpR family regulator